VSFGIIRRKPKPLGHVIDVWRCLRCGTTITENTDSQTFSNPAPLECKKCPGEPDMQARRYYSTAVASSRAYVEGGVKGSEEWQKKW
jgi:hypothetical protein